MGVVKDLEDARKYIEQQNIEIAKHLETIGRRDAEISRKERLLRTTQQFCDKYKKRTTQSMPQSARREAMEIAKQLAMSTGTTQRVLL